MAYIFADGFDFYTTSNTAQSQLTSMGPWTNTNYDIGIHTTTRFNTGKALSWRDNAWISKTFDNNSTNTLYISFAFYHNYNLDNGSSNFFRVETFDTTTYQVNIHFMNNGDMQIWRGPSWSGGTQIGTFSGVLKAFTWHHFQFKIVIDSTNGAVYIRRDGDPNDTYSLTGVNTKNSSTSTVRQALFVGTYYYASYMDDLLINDSSGTELNTWPGEFRCYALSPTAAGDSTDFTPTPTQANYLNVYETAPNTSNYNSSNVSGATDLFAIADLASAPASIYAVVPRCVANKADAGSRSAAIVIKSGTTVSPGTSKVLSTSYLGIFQPYITNPDTGVAWTYSTVNSLQAGYKISS